MEVALDLAVIGIVAAFFIGLLTYCLRVGVVGGGKGPWAQDAYREKQPIRYWTGIAGLTIGAASSTAGFIYVVWILLR